MLRIALSSTLLLRWIFTKKVRSDFFSKFLHCRINILSLSRIARANWDLSERSNVYSQIVSLLKAGNTYRTTDIDRTRLVDEAILRFIGSKNVSFADIGVSDGSASFHLLSHLPNGSQIYLYDLVPWYFYEKRFLWGKAIFEPNGTCAGVFFPGFMLNLPLLQSKIPLSGLNRIPVINPSLTNLIPGILIQKFDILEDEMKNLCDIIKISNLLNETYFSIDTILRTITRFGNNLSEGGRIYISQNHDSYDEGEAFFALERRGQRLEYISGKNKHTLENFVTSGLDIT